ERVIQPMTGDGWLMRSDGTYLISGGLGGLGLTVARWVGQRGARHFVLLCRAQTSPSGEEELGKLRRSGIEVMVVSVDVAQEDQLKAVFSKIRQIMPPLKGVIHAAGILDDGILLQLDRSRFQSVMLPKVHGAWNLHTLTLHEQLD